MEIALFWFLFSVAVGIWADKKGRSGIGWFLLSILLSPLLGLVFCAAVSDLSKAPAAPAAMEDTHVKCPACAEYVLPEAKVCKHCGGALSPQHNYVATVMERKRTANKEEGRNLLIGIGAVATVIFIAYLAAR